MGYKSKVLKIFMDCACAELKKCDTYKDLKETKRDLMNVVYDMANHDTISSDMEVFMIRRIRNTFYTIRYKEFGMNLTITSRYRRFMY